MAFYHIEFYNARPQNDGGAIDGVKGNTRAGTAELSFTSTNTTAAVAKAQILAAVRNNAHFAAFDNSTFSTKLSAAQNTPGAGSGAYSLLIGKHLYRYRFGSGASAAAAKSAMIDKDLS